MSSRAAHKRTSTLGVQSLKQLRVLFKQSEVPRKRPRIERDVQATQTHPAPSTPLFTFTHTLRNALPVAVNDVAHEAVVTSSADDTCAGSPSLLDEELEGMILNPPASGKVRAAPPILPLCSLRVKGQNQMLQDWLTFSAKPFLYNSLRSESLSQQGSVCVSCDRENQDLIQCRDCLHQWAQCAECLLGKHTLLPMHQFQKWNGTYFENISSSALGYVFHLGHAGRACDLGFERVLVIGDITGIHTVIVRFCRHPGRGGQSHQLLDANIFPCSEDRPQTGFTFNLLRLFSLMSTESRLSAQRFYNVLACQTNPVFPQEVPDRYREFMRASREWQWLQVVKRSGSSSQLSLGLARGDLALRCPACPRDGVNFERRDVPSQDEYAC
jgi:hypothetical protein